jgi:hypothetical protein
MARLTGPAKPTYQSTNPRVRLAMCRRELFKLFDDLTYLHQRRGWLLEKIDKHPDSPARREAAEREVEWASLIRKWVDRAESITEDILAIYDTIPADEWPALAQEIGLYAAAKDRKDLEWWLLANLAFLEPNLRRGLRRATR